MNTRTCTEFRKGFIKILPIANFKLWLVFTFFQFTKFSLLTLRFIKSNFYKDSHIWIREC